MRRALLLVAIAGCGDNIAVHTDAARADTAMVDSAITDAHLDAPARMVRVFGNVNYNGGLENVRVITLEMTPAQSCLTDMNGDFYFDAPEGAPLIMEVLPPLGSGLIPMVRGVVAEDHLRPRVFYLMGPPDIAAAASVSESFDPTEAIVEVDFRNSMIGGYGAILADGTQTLMPRFGLVYDTNGNPQVGEQTVTGGDGTTLLLGGLPVGHASFAPIVPAAATLPCHTDGDAQPLPLLAGVTTWFDFECGNATD